LCNLLFELVTLNLQPMNNKLEDLRIQWLSFRSRHGASRLRSVAAHLHACFAIAIGVLRPRRLNAQTGPWHADACTICCMQSCPQCTVSRCAEAPDFQTRCTTGRAAMRRSIKSANPSALPDVSVFRLSNTFAPLAARIPVAHSQHSQIAATSWPWRSQFIQAV
jgi:hypothetical protein